MDGMNPGEFREVLAFYALKREKNARGGIIGEYDFAFELPAKVVPMKPITSVEGGKLTIIQPYEVKVRYEDGMLPDPDMKVIWSDRDYLIRNIKEGDTRQRVISFMITKAG